MSLLGAHLRDPKAPKGSGDYGEAVKASLQKKDDSPIGNALPIQAPKPKTAEVQQALDAVPVVDTLTIPLESVITPIV